jgi:hypothetical protein
MRNALAALAMILIALPGSVAQTPPAEITFDFADSVPGQAPEGWTLMLAAPGTTATLLTDTDQPFSGAKSLNLTVAGAANSARTRAVAVFNAGPYRGRFVSLKAALRLSEPSTSDAYLAFRAESPGRIFPNAFTKTQLRTSWSTVELVRFVPPEATKLVVVLTQVG